MWRMMLDYHGRQYDILVLANNNGTTKISVRSEPQHHAITLVHEWNSLSSNFSQWMSAHKSYLTSINGWLRQCIDYSRKHSKSSRKWHQQFSPTRDIHVPPPIFVTCKNWLLLLQDLPVKEVVSSIKDLVNVISHFLPSQESHGASKSSFSSPRKAVQNRLRENNHSNPSSVDWSLNYDQLQSALTIFLDRLKTFAELSVTKYEELQTSVKLARDHYESSRFTS